MRDATLNKVRTVSYVALDFTTGLSDVTLTVRRPDGSLYEFESGPVTQLVLTEVADGVYQGQYTPDELGLWTEKVVSVTNGDKAIGSFNVVDDDISAVSDKIDALDTKVDSVDGKVDSIQTDVTAIDGKVDTIDAEVGAIQTDVTAIDAKIDTVQTTLDNLPMVRSGGYFAN